ncbi:MAG: MMPL family transporter [Candidatus Sulfomarinibacteraceae bacterium]
MGTVLRTLALWSFDRATLVLFSLAVLLIASAPLVRELRIDTDFAKLLARDNEAADVVLGSGSGPAGRTPLLVSITAGEGGGADLEVVAERFVEMVGEVDEVTFGSQGAFGQDDPHVDGALLNAALLNQKPPRYGEFISRMLPTAMERQIRKAKRRLALADDPNLREALSTDLLGVMELARPFVESRVCDQGAELLGGARPPTGSVLIWLSPHGRADDSGFCVDLMTKLDAIAQRAVAGPGLRDDVRISFAGLHVMTAESTTTLRRDLLTITVWASGLLLGLLFLALRRVSLVVLCFAPLAVSVVLLLDLATLLFNPIYFVTIGFVAIVLGLGLDVAVHLAGRLSAKLETLSRREAIGSTVQDVGLPLAAGMLSTAAAFLALLITGRPALVEFGLLTASGLLLTFMTTVVVFPALVRFLVPTESPPSRARLLTRSRGFEFFERNRRVCFVVGLVILVLTLPWAARFRWHMDPLSFFAGGTRSVETTRTTETSTGIALTSAFQIHLEAPMLGSAIEALRIVDGALEEAVRSGGVFGFESPSMLLPYEPGVREADSPGSLDRAAVLDLVNRFGITRTNEHDRYLEMLEHAAALPTEPAAVLDLLREDLGELVATSPDRVAFRITVWPTSSAAGGELFSSEPAAQAVSMLADLELRDDVRVGVVGTAQVLNAFQETAGSSFLSVGALALVLVLGVLWISFRNLTSVALSLLPLVGALPAMLAGVVLLEIPVTPTAIAFGAIILGVGIDDAVHLVFLSGPPRRRGVSEALAEVGPVVTLTTVSTIVGFGCLMWSSHPVVSSLGSAVALGVAGAWVFTMLLTPTLLRHRRGSPGISMAAVLLLIIAAVPPLAWAQSDDASELLSRMHERAVSTEAVSCRFRQLKTVSQLATPVETEGTLLFSHPDRFRIEIHGDLNLFLLSDGKQLTMVDLDLDEVERIALEEVGLRATLMGPFAMLFDLGPDEVEKRFAVERRDGDDELTVLVFRPTREPSETREIRLTVDKRLRTRRIEWLFANGDSIFTEFSGWRKRTRPADDFFEFNGDAQWELLD